MSVEEIPCLSWRELAKLIAEIPEKKLDESVCISVAGSETYAEEMKYYRGQPYLEGF